MATLDTYDYRHFGNIDHYKEVRNIKKKTVLVMGLLGVLLVFGAAVALAQNTSEKTKDAENHECTPEMMKNTPEKCTGQMMRSGACENMMNAANESSMQAGCSEMMGNSKPAGDTKTKENGHCTNMGSGMGSMMDSGAKKF